MLPQIPTYVAIAFIVTTLLTLWLVRRVVANAQFSARVVNRMMVALIVWLGLHMIIALSGFYFRTISQVPPPFALVIIPTFLVILYLFGSRQGRKFMDQLPFIDLVWLSVVRIPVEIVLYWLFVHGTIPELMTFSGRNFDILAGLTAPLVAMAMHRNMIGRRVLLIWNFMSLALLIFIIVNALLSAPSALQQFGFDQPNIGLLHFPFVWLAAFVAPAVLISHLVMIRQLTIRARSFN